MARRSQGDGSLDRGAWVLAARDAFEKGGVAAVRIEVLARNLEATPGSFYWHFKKREDLFDALLADWKQANMRSFEAASPANVTAERRLIDIAVSWINGTEFSSTYDAAIRDWARTSTKVAQIVRKIDARRVEILTNILSEYGLDEEESFIRARVMYFHQVGYYALKISESRDQRFELLSQYFEVLVGRRMSADGAAYLASQKQRGRGAKSNRIVERASAPSAAGEL